MNNDKYILEGKEVKPVEDLIEWAKWFETNNRIVDCTIIGCITISTVFLGLDHRFGKGEPILFETMISGCKEEYQERYCTWDEAIEGHKKAVKLVESKLNN